MQTEANKAVQAIYDKHKQKLDNLKENRARSEEENWSDSEIKSVDDQIQILASILSDIYWNVITPKKQILDQSLPLTPELEKTWNAAREIVMVGTPPFEGVTVKYSTLEDYMKSL